MSIFGRPVDASTMVSLTEQGKEAISRDMVKDMRAYSVLSELDQHSPQSLGTLSRQTRMNVNAVQMTVNRLKRQRMVSMNDFEDRQE